MDKVVGACAYLQIYTSTFAPFKYPEEQGIAQMVFQVLMLSSRAIIQPSWVLDIIQRASTENKIYGIEGCYTTPTQLHSIDAVNIINIIRSQSNFQRFINHITILQSPKPSIKGAVAFLN